MNDDHYDIRIDEKRKEASKRLFANIQLKSLGEEGLEVNVKTPLSRDKFLIPKTTNSIRNMPGMEYELEAVWVNRQAQVLCKYSNEKDFFFKKYYYNVDEREKVDLNIDQYQNRTISDFDSGFDEDEKIDMENFGY